MSLYDELRALKDAAALAEQKREEERQKRLQAALRDKMEMIVTLLKEAASGNSDFLRIRVEPELKELVRAELEREGLSCERGALYDDDGSASWMVSWRKKKG
jgi:hypothetical protein